MAPFNGKKVDTWKGAITEIERKLRFEIDQSSTKVMEEVEKINKKFEVVVQLTTECQQQVEAQPQMTYQMQQQSNFNNRYNQYNHQNPQNFGHNHQQEGYYFQGHNQSSQGYRGSGRIQRQRTFQYKNKKGNVNANGPSHVRQNLPPTPNPQNYYPNISKTFPIPPQTSNENNGELSGMKQKPDYTTRGRGQYTDSDVDDGSSVASSSSQD